MDPQEQAERLRQMFGGTPGAAQFLQPNIGNLLGRMGQQGPQMAGPRQYQGVPQPPRPPGPQMAGPQLGQPTPQPNIGALLGQMGQQGTPQPNIGGLLGQMGGNVPPPAGNAPQGPAGAYGGGSPTQQPLSQAAPPPTPPGAPTPQPPANKPGGLPQSPFVQGPPQPPEPPNYLFQNMMARPMPYYQPRQGQVRLPLPKNFEGVG